MPPPERRPSPANLVDVLDHGADSTGQRDSSDAFDAAWAAALLAAASHGGGARIAIPAGVYGLARTPRWDTPPDSGMRIAVEGDGASVTTLCCRGAEAGLRIRQGHASQTVRVRGLTLVPDCPTGACGAAIEFDAPELHTSLDQTALFEDITVAAVGPLFPVGATSFPGTFTGGLKLATLFGARLSGIRISGAAIQTRVTLSATAHSSRPDLVAVGSTHGLQPGMAVEGPGVAPGTTLAEIGPATLVLSQPAARPLRAGESVSLLMPRPIPGSFGVRFSRRCIAVFLSEVSVMYMHAAFWQTGYVESPILRGCGVAQCTIGWHTDLAAIDPGAEVNGCLGLALEIDSSSDWVCDDVALDLARIHGVRLRHTHLAIRRGGAGEAAVRLTDCERARLDSCDLDAPNGAAGLHIRHARGGANFSIVAACRFGADVPVLCDPGTYGNAVVDAMWVGTGGVHTACPLVDLDGRNLCTWFAGHGPSVDDGTTGTAIRLAGTGWEGQGSALDPQGARGPLTP